MREAVRAAEAAHRLGVTTREVYAMVERGELEPCNIDGKLGVWIQNDEDPGSDAGVFVDSSR